MGRSLPKTTHTRALRAAVTGILFASVAMVAPASANAEGSISGTVTDAVSGTPVPNICVDVDGIGNEDDGGANTAADGTYTVNGLDPGDYGVSFEACGNEDYVFEVYDNKQSFTQATPVEVSDGQTTQNIDAELAPAGTISGTVTADGTGSPLAGVCVKLDGSTEVAATTNALGQYTIEDLAPGSGYKVFFDACATDVVASEHYDDAPDFDTATPVSVVAGVTTTVNEGLALAGSISGTVTDETGLPRDGVCVEAHRTGSNATYTAETGLDGGYDIPGLPSAQYKVEFRDCSSLGLIDEFHADKPDLINADPVQVTAPADTGGIDAELAIDTATGAISGSVQKPNGDPLAGICATALPESQPGVQFEVQTGVNGTYTIEDLEPDEYRVEFRSCATVGYLTEYYNDQPTLTSANPILLDPDEEELDIDATMEVDPNVDITPPAAPTITGSNPPSPANVATPFLIGTAEPGSTVEVYTSSDCSGSPVSSGTAAQFASPGIDVPAAENSATTFRATATDSSNNVSACSGPFTYTEDSIAPAAPSLTATSPAGPASDGNPEVIGSAENGSTVLIYRSTNCSGAPAATGSATALSTGMTVAVPNDGTTTLTAKASDAASNLSACSSPLEYERDSTAPAAPNLNDTDPDSPANENNPEVKGSAENGSTVNIYTTSGCTGTPVATGTAAELADPGLTVTVANDSTTELRATATDGVGNVSPCSAPRTYVEDSTAPAAPNLNDTDPNSPANDNNPEVKGSAEAGSIVRLYTTSDCSGLPVDTGGAAALASPGLTASVAANSTTDFRATATDAAGNTSTCSDAQTYVEDSIAPAAPTLSSVSPAGPANDNNPEIIGSAESGTTVSIYRSADCSGPEAATGSAAAFSGSGITIPVPNDSTSTLSSRATDSAGNVSPCSSNTLGYVEDSTAPAAPNLSDTDPDSPANETNPEVKGSAENGSTVRLYTSNDCTGTPVATGTAAELADPGLTVTVANDSTTLFRATATDGVGNVSPCSAARTYVEDSTAPAPPNLNDTDPNSPANENDPEVKGSAESGSTVKLYTTSDCTGGPVETGTAAELASPGFTINVGDDSTTDFRATATDTAGNTSACSAARTYVEDSTAPAAPTLAATNPASPSTDANPKVTGSAESGATVKIYRSADCSGTEAATAGGALLNTTGITVNIPSTGTTQLTAKMIDAAGNASSCSAPLEYTRVAPAPPPADDPPPSDPPPSDPGGDTPPPPPPAAQCVVPNLKGMSTAAAKAALEAARCALGKVTKKKVKKGKSGKVLAQSPAAGQALPAGTAVSVTVSSVKKKKK